MRRHEISGDLCSRRARVFDVLSCSSLLTFIRILTNLMASRGFSSSSRSSPAWSSIQTDVAISAVTVALRGVREIKVSSPAIVPATIDSETSCSCAVNCGGEMIAGSAHLRATTRKGE